MEGWEEPEEATRRSAQARVYCFVWKLLDMLSPYCPPRLGKLCKTPPVPPWAGEKFTPASCISLNDDYAAAQQQQPLTPGFCEPSP